MGSASVRPQRPSNGSAVGRSPRRVPGIGWLALAAVLVIGVVAWLGARSEPPEARVVARLLDEGRWAEARQTLERWRIRRPGSAEAYLAQARLEFVQGRLTEAFEATQKARALGHGSDPIERLQGLILAEGGRDAEAEAILSPAFERSGGKDLEVAEALAKVLLRTYKLPQAERVLRRWTEVAPADARPYLWLTEVDRRTVADPLARVGHYLAALERDPRLAAARLGLAEAYYAAKRSADAARAFREYLAERPGDPKAHLGAARAARHLGDDGAVAHHLGEALRLAPNDPGALKERAAMELRGGETGAALATLDRALAVDPLDVETLYQRALVLARLGRREEAEAARRAVAKLKGEQDEILAVHEKLLADPDNLALRGRVARWMTDHGQADEAAKWARLILAKEPSNPGMNRLLARYHRKRGETGLANFYRMQAGGEE